MGTRRTISRLFFSFAYKVERGPSLSDLPSILVPDSHASINEIFRFALSFDGYKGGFEHCAQIANPAIEAWRNSGRLPDSLEDLRTSLFFEQRRWRHFGETPDEETTRYLRDLVRAIADLSGGEVICERPDI